MLNEVRLIGRLGADPDIRKTSNGKPVASLRVATWECFWNEQNHDWETISEWHSVAAWGDQVNNRIAKLKKGNLVLVEGKLRTRKYQDQNGVEKYTTEIVGNVRAMPKAEGKAGNQPENAAPVYSQQGTQQPQSVKAPQQAGFFPPEEKDDLPF